MKMKRMIRLTEKEKMDCMSDIQVIRNACVYAISELMKKGSCQFATKVDGKWIIADWSLVLEELNNLLVKEENK